VKVGEKKRKREEHGEMGGDVEKVQKKKGKGRGREKVKKKKK